MIDDRIIFGSDSAVIDSRYKTRVATRFETWEGSSCPRMTHFSAAERREYIDEAACEQQTSLHTA
jgi:hypothetical protein